MADHVIREIELPVDPAEAWTWIAGPDALGTWIGAEVELDVRPAGRGCFRFDDGETRFAMVETVDPGRCLEFRWWPARERDAASRVAIELEPSDDGTRVRVTESRLPSTSRHVASALSHA